MRVRLLTVLDIGRTIIKMEARKTESDNMENVKQNFLQSHFLKDDQRLSGMC